MGLERARLLADLEVRIGDVRPGDDCGYIAFSSVLTSNEKGDGVTRAMKSRKM